jgi:hypothetical protein
LRAMLREVDWCKNIATGKSESEKENEEINL